MERTPYGKTQRSRSEIEPGMKQPLTRAEVAMHFVRAGFVVIFQDCRGRYNSEGIFTKYLSEGPDGYDTCAWIVEQPWCDGKIGTMGLSYAAHTQAALACLNPPGLACMVLDSGGFSSAYRTGIRQGGAFELKQLTWAYNHAKESPEAKNDPLIAEALEAEDISPGSVPCHGRRGVRRYAGCPSMKAMFLSSGARALSAISGRRLASMRRVRTIRSLRCRWLFCRAGTMLMSVRPSTITRACRGTASVRSR